MKRCGLLIVLFVLSTSSGVAQTKLPVEGVWKITEWTEAGRTITDPQPSLVIVTKGYYSVALLTATRAKVTPPQQRGKLTDTEKIERFEAFRRFVGVSGSYEIKGSTIVMRTIVAMSPWDMNRQTPQELTFKIEGPNTLWLVPTGEGAANFGIRMKLMRLE